MNGLTNQIKEDIKRYLETNQNKHRTTQNLWDTTKAVPSRKFIALQAHFRKQGKNRNKQSNFSFKRSRKNPQIKPKVSRGKEIIRIRAEINRV